jgi:hypothetical protein
MNFDEQDDEVSSPQGSSLVQSDLAMNIFMVMLVVLSVLSIASSVAVTQGFRVDQKPDNAARPVALVPGWRPVQPVNPRFVIRDGRVFRLDLTQLAMAISQDKNLPDSASLSDSSRTLTKDPDPSTYRVFLYLFKNVVPENLVNYSFDISDIKVGEANAKTLPEQFVNDIKFSAGFDIFFFPGEEANAWLLFSKLNKAGIVVRLLKLRQKEVFAIERSTSKHSFEETYK